MARKESKIFMFMHGQSKDCQSYFMNGLKGVEQRGIATWEM